MDTDKQSTEANLDRRRSHEREWVKRLCDQIKPSIQLLSEPEGAIEVCCEYPVPYAAEVFAYDAGKKKLAKHVTPRAFKSDLLILQRKDDLAWPLVIVECKYKAVTTHDAHTYNSKAGAHKNIHPYLRYGFLVGGMKGEGIPGRLFRASANFDFLVAWQESDPSGAELETFKNLLAKEVRAAQFIRAMWMENPAKRKKTYVIHKHYVTHPQ